jgi:hypothetical protein
MDKMQIKKMRPKYKCVEASANMYRVSPRLTRGCGCLVDEISGIKRLVGQSWELSAPDTRCCGCVICKRVLRRVLIWIVVSRGYKVRT